MDWAKTNARRDKKHLKFEIWCGLYSIFDGRYKWKGLCEIYNPHPTPLPAPRYKQVDPISACKHIIIGYQQADICIKQLSKEIGTTTYLRKWLGDELGRQAASSLPTVHACYLEGYSLTIVKLYPTKCKETSLREILKRMQHSRIS